MVTTAKKATPGLNTRTFTTFKVLHKCYHRNGISGIGFYTLWVEWPEDGYPGRRGAIITVSGNDVESFRAKKSHDPDTRVLMLDDTGGVDLEQTMRGDHFHEALCKYLVETGA